MMDDKEFEDLKTLLRSERRRGLANHWTYSLARHTALYFHYLKEKQRRDVESIDAAFEKAGRTMEAAE